MTSALTTYIVYLLGPMFRPISRWLLAPDRARPTWHYETALVACLLIITAVCTSPNPFGPLHIEGWKQFAVVWFSAGAVLGSFLHAKVGYRMSEAMIASKVSNESCHEWLGSYWLAKEILWLFVFLISGAYPAIVGNVIFLLYPAWRRVHVEEREILRGGYTSSL